MIVDNHGLHLLAQLFLGDDTYSLKDKADNEYSVTELLQSIRKIILNKRALKNQIEPVTELVTLVSARIGQAVDDALQRVLEDAEALKTILGELGYSSGVIERLEVNPEPFTGKGIYTHQRRNRDIAGISVSGEFDFILNGEIIDLKTTKTYTYINRVTEDKFKWQMSLYAWIFSDMVQKNTGTLVYLLTDWSPSNKPDHPPHAAPSARIPLYSTQEVERFIRKKVRELQRYQDTPEKELPYCTEEELWMKEPVFQYFSKEGNTRASKNFKTLAEAMNHKVEKNAGVVVRKPGKAMACKYCSVYAYCSQKDELIKQGLLDE